MLWTEPQGASEWNSRPVRIHPVLRSVPLYTMHRAADARGTWIIRWAASAGSGDSGQRRRI